LKALYLESSAALAWLFNEPSAVGVLSAMNEADVVVTSLLTIVEVERAFHRALGQGLVKETAAHKLRGVLARERSKWITMSLSEEVLTRAGRAFPVEPVRTLGAIHLATALTFAEAFPELKLIALDRRVVENATSLGLTFP